jgi:hypothetical protein
MPDFSWNPASTKCCVKFVDFTMRYYTTNHSKSQGKNALIWKKNWGNSNGKCEILRQTQGCRAIDKQWGAAYDKI